MEDLRHKFGYQYNVECDAHRARLIAEGYKMGSAEMHFAVVRAYEDAHRNDLSYKERQAIWQTKQIPTGSNVFLTFEEIEHLKFLLENSNNPTGQNISMKLEKLNEDL